MTRPVLPYGSKAAELWRTAEMVVELSQEGKIDLAIWLIYDSNRYDAASMKMLAEYVQMMKDDERKSWQKAVSHAV